MTDGDVKHSESEHCDVLGEEADGIAPELCVCRRGEKFDSREHDGPGDSSESTVDSVSGRLANEVDRFLGFSQLDLSSALRTFSMVHWTLSDSWIGAAVATGGRALLVPGRWSDNSSE